MTGLPAQHKVWKQYTTDNGLLSNEVYDMLQDRIGFIWLVTDRGICKFDGYTFTSPVDTSSMNGTGAYFPFEDHLGRIWFCRLEKTVWFVENDTIKYWKYNSILNQYKDHFTLIEDILVDKKENVWLRLGTFGTLLIHPDGTFELQNASTNSQMIYSLIDQKEFISFNLRPQTDQQDDPSKQPIDIILSIEGQKRILLQRTNVDIRPRYPAMFDDENGDYLLMHGQTIWHVQDDELKEQFSIQQICRKITRSKKGEMLLSSFEGERPGLHHYSSLTDLRNGESQNFLPNVKVCDLLIDHEEGWWAATLGQGIYYCRNPNVDIYDQASGLLRDDVRSLASNQKDKVYIGLWPNDLVQLHVPTGQIKSLADESRFPKGEISALYYDTSNKRLYRSFPFAYLTPLGWNSIFTHSSDLQDTFPLPAKDINPSVHGYPLWLSAPNGFYGYYFAKNEVKAFRIPNLKGAERTFSIAEDYSGQVWVSTINGLHVLEKDQYQLPPFQHSALRYRCSDLEILSDSSLAMAFLGYGILIRRPDKTMVHLTMNAGLSTNYISKLYLAPDGTLFGCSKEGLNQIKNVEGHWSITILDQGHGLPSNLVNDVMTYQGELWIATHKGLAHFKELPKPLPSRKPILTAYFADTTEHQLLQNAILPHHKNKIVIRFHAFDFRSQGEILYRYRFSLDDSTFTFTKLREINFPQLSPGDYHFEVQAKNTDGIWSEPANLSFRITPPWWTSWWFISFTGICIAFGTSKVVNMRLRATRNKAIIQNKIKDLELAALRAQMNPHFIFNCLGSIQQFIAENDKVSATSYLAKFAKLIRLSLHSSVNGRHSLSEEVEMLDYYLTLEQMRFKERFSYSIEIKTIEQPKEIYLPPMLIQPFVENAVLHGMKNKTAQGNIHIEFNLKDDLLVVWVSDNGPGVSLTRDEASKAHKSIGITLTQRRLNLHSTNAFKGNFTMDQLTSTEGTILGTRVEIRIPLA